MNRLNWCISPGTMGAVSLACDLLGVDHVRAGGWTGPFFLVRVSEEDATALVGLLDEQAEGLWRHTLTRENRFL